MNYINSSYEAFAKRLNPIGRIAFVPYSTLRVSQQLVHFLLLNVTSYFGLIFIYNYNLLNILQKTKMDKLTFAELFQQKQFNNKHRVRDGSRPVVSEMEVIFDVPIGFNDFINKVWLRTDYYYDRMVVHAPNWIKTAITFEKPSYLYNPNNLPLHQNNQDVTDDIKRHPEIFNIVDKDGKLHSIEVPFVPKPYIINESVKRKQTSASDLNSTQDSVAKNNATGCPNIPITSLFSEPIVTPEIRTISPAADAEENTATVDRPIETISSSKSFFRKIKIRKKSKSEKHPTYGNYEQLAQAIKNIIPQPNCSTDGTIGPDIIRIAWNCRGHYEGETGVGGTDRTAMVFGQEFRDIGNTGLNTAKSYLDQVHGEFPWISFADLYTFAGCVAIEYMGGPEIEWKPGRTDGIDSLKLAPTVNLPFPTKDLIHSKEVFCDRLGFNTQEIVALIGGGYGIGGCHAIFSGFNVTGAKSPFTWNNDFFKTLLNEAWKNEVVPQSKVSQYYNHNKTSVMLNTDMELMRCPEFKKWVEIFAEDNDFFNQQFAIAFAKLLELGVNRDENGIQRAKHL